MELRKASVADFRVNANTAIVDGASHRLVFLSVIGYDNIVRNIAKEINKRSQIYIERFGNYQTGYKEYTIDRYKDTATDYTHAIIAIKDKADTNDAGVVSLTAYVYASMTPEEFDLDKCKKGTAQAPNTLVDKIYDKLYEHMPTPMIKDWKNFIVDQVIQQNFVSELRSFKNEGDLLRAFKLTMTSAILGRIVQEGLSSGRINIRGTNTTSEELSEVTGMNDYLTKFSVPAADKLQESFKAKFVPNESEYNERLQTLIDYASYRGGIDLYEPQKVVVQATSNNLDKNDVSFIIATPGSGKTALGTSVVYTHAKKPNTTNIVVAPGHLVEKWVSEINRISPLTEAMVVESFEHFKSIEPLINDKKRRKHLFLVMSKDSAKSTYEKRPAVTWSSSREAYKCPSCGGTLQKKEIIGSGRDRVEQWVNLSKIDFFKEYSFNQTCENEVSKWDEKEKTYVEVPCGESLWTPFIKEEGGGRWIRLPKGVGWVEKQHLQTLFDEYVVQEDLDRTGSKILGALSEAIQSEEQGTTIIRAPRKYSMANYIRKYYKGKIDYLIADELHKYKGGNSMQGQAFGDLVCAANKVICLTGTLLNGYADSLFYILYRAFPRTMQKEGFEYADEKEFARTFGVVRYDDRFNTNSSGRRTSRIGSRKEKFLPGVSPLVFTKFLLENAVFLNLDDISDGLPNYQEIPIAVRMDTELQEQYESLEREFRNLMGHRSRTNAKVMGSMLQTLSAYPDSPYDQPAVIHPDTGNTLLEIPDLPKQARNKEQELMRICQERVAAGEKVLVYYHWTNRTDVAERLPEMCKEAGLRTTVLKSNSSSMRDREAWIAERTPNTDVLFCNPTLVETGLDLLDYTTIIFYQVGYDIFTMRQASKRSYRLNQTKDVRVYFLYYQDTIQEQALSLMATKLQASQAIEGNFSEEGLHALSNNEDLLTQIANSVVQGIKHAVDINVFEGTKERVVHSSPDATFDPFGDIFAEGDDRPVEVAAAVEAEVIAPRITFSTYAFKDSLVPLPKKKRRKSPTVRAQDTNAHALLAQLRSKELHIMNL